MLSIDLNQISSVVTNNSNIERIYYGTDLIWTDNEPFQFIIQLSDDTIHTFDLSVIDTQWDGLHPFSITDNGLVYSHCFREKLGRHISSSIITEIRDNQSTDNYGIEILASCEGLKDLKSVVFPKTKTVYYRCFRTCNNLSSISMPNLETIGDEAFVGCKNLSSINFPKVNFIGDSAFTGCSALTSVSFASLENVPALAFGHPSTSYDSNLLNVYMPNVLSVNGSAFENCKKLSSVYAPLLQYIDSYAFNNCESLEYIDLNSIIKIGYMSFSNTPIKNIIIPSCLSVQSNAFNACLSATNLYAPKLINIDSQAFIHCPLSSVNIRSAEYIGDRAFNDTYNQNNLLNLELDKIKQIDANAFKNSCISSMTIYNELADGTPIILSDALDLSSIIYVQDETIYDELCKSESLSSTEFRIILLSEKNKNIECEIFDDYSYSNVYRKITLDKTTKNLAAINQETEQLQKPFNQWFNDKSQLVQTLRPNNYFSIIDLNSNILSIDNKCFQNFINLSSVNLPVCKTIGNYAFNNCSSLYDLNLDSVEYIGDYAFNNCTSLTEIDVPNLSSFGIRWLFGNDNITTIKCNGIKNATDLLMTSYGTLQHVELNSVENISAFIAHNLTHLQTLKLPSLTSITSVLTPSRPTELKELDIRSISYDDFINNNLSGYFARGFDSNGCSLTCNDGIFIIN